MGESSAETTPPETETSETVSTSTSPVDPVPEPPGNAAPILVLDVPIEGWLGSPVMLDGAGSSDPDGDDVAYTWSFLDRPAGAQAGLQGSDQPLASFVPDVTGLWTVHLEITDGDAAAEAWADILVDTPFTADVFDPGEVHLVGTTSAGSCSRDVMMRFSEPEIGIAGFDCYFDGRGASIRADGRLIYENTFEWAPRAFHCDGVCEMQSGDAHPINVLQNDAILASSCDPDFDPRINWWVDPDGTMLEQCEGDVVRRVWRDDTGVEQLEIPDSWSLVALGVGDVALIGGSVGYQLLDSKGTRTWVLGLPDDRGRYTVRATPTGGFWLVLEGSVGVDGQLWEIDTAGKAAKVGDYPALPPGASQTFDAGKIDRNGAWYQLGRASSGADAVIRRTVAGASDVEFEETDSSLVDIHISALVTGP